MKTYIEQMWDNHAALNIEIASLERFKEGALLTDEQFDLIEEQINATKALKDVIKKRIDYDTEYLGVIKDMVLLGTGFMKATEEGIKHISPEDVFLDLHQEITELKASHHGEVIGHEVHLKKIKQERDELQTLYTQQGINMFKLQKRVDTAIRLLVEAELYQSEPNIDLAVKTLKGDQYDEHRKKAEEAISKGASLTNHRIEL
ncbi:hypothetical protein [Acinetobacter baumannii]